MCKVTPLSGPAAAKASLNRALEYIGADAKPRDLSMARMKFR